ncbi:MAG: YdcF family protein [Nitrosarchaeum sp.]|nr:YdcF family protein [Nitrosarchaeum sp.]
MEESDTTDRCRRQSRQDSSHAIFLYRQGAAPQIIMSGHGPNNRPRPYTEAQAMHDYAVAHNIPKEHILLEAKSTSTLANAYYTKHLLAKPLGLRHLIIVTNAFHNHRARRIFTWVYGANYHLTFSPSLDTGPLLRRLLRQKKELLKSMVFYIQRATLHQPSETADLDKLASP